MAATAAQKLAWSRANPDSVRASQRKYAASPLGKEKMLRQHLMRRYGLTPYGVFYMFEEQGYSCACCGSTHPGVKWCVDHDHKTGHVRGVVCQDCNLAASHVHDSPAVARALADYLEVA
jgi:hypothetical protein